MSRDALAARLVKAGVLAAGCAVVVQTAVHLVNRAWLDSPRLNADLDESIPTWLSGGATFAAALGALTLASLIGRRRVQLILLAAIFGLFAFDDLIGLHERASIKVTSVLGIEADYARALWPAMYLPLLIFVLVALWQLSRRMSAQASVGIRLGLGCLVAAVLLEMLWTTWHLSGGEIGDWPDTIEVAVEEGLELGGWLLIATGLAGAAVERIGPRRVTAETVSLRLGLRRLQSARTTAKLERHSGAVGK